jgi:hypothetical protein
MIKTFLRWLRLSIRVARIGKDMPMKAIEDVVDVLEHGDGNPYPWREQTAMYHWQRLKDHKHLWMLGDNNEPHLEHMATRALMMLEQGRNS